MVKKAFITGITGQDGSYLTEFLLNKDYHVAGLIRKDSASSFDNIKHLHSQVKVYFGDLLNPKTIAASLDDFKPDEIYNLAAQSSAVVSVSDKIGTALVNGIGAVQIFEKANEIVPNAKIFQASSSELFGFPQQTPQDENTPFAPANPYGAAKLYAHWMADISRKDKNKPQFISCGILFNHESPRRGLNFVTRKVSAAVACIKNKKKEGVPLNEFGEPIVQNGKLKLGSLLSTRDWGYAPDFVEAMWLILQQEKPDDFVIATGKVHTVEELCQEAFAVVGLDWQDYVMMDSNLVSPAQTVSRCGDYSKAKKILGWTPKTTFKKLVQIMVYADLARFS